MISSDDEKKDIEYAEKMKNLLNDYINEDINKIK